MIDLNEDIKMAKSYTADFETTTDKNDLRIWAWGICDLNDFEHFEYDRIDKMVAKNKLWYSLQQYYKVAFAKREHLEEIFPNLKKYPYLLWYYRIKRIILKLTDGSGAKYIENQRTVSSARINETEQHFNAVGLEDYLK